MTADTADTENRADAGSPLRDEPSDQQITSSEVVFDGKIWDVRRETFVYNGADTVREFVDHTGAVAIVALDENDRMLLIKQYRHPIRSREWEIPAGLLDEPGEDFLAAAKRELGEEADLEADQWNVLTDYATTPGGNNEMIRIYVARGVKPTADAFEREDEEADIEVRWVDLDEVVDAVLRRELQNPNLVIASLALAASRSRGWGSLGAGDAPWPEFVRLHPAS